MVPLQPAAVNMIVVPAQIEPPPVTVGAAGFAPFAVITAAALLSDSPQLVEHVAV